MNKNPLRARFSEREYDAIIAEEPELYEVFLEEPGLPQTLLEP